jgi:hypothetical protein
MPARLEEMNMDIVNDNEENGTVIEHAPLVPEVEPALEPVLFAIKRLEEVVERETKLLLDGETIDLAEINSHKSRGAGAEIAAAGAGCLEAEAGPQL